MAAGKKKFLSKSDILAKVKRKVVEFEAPALGGWIYLRGLSLVDAIALQDESPLDQVKGFLRKGIVDLDGGELYELDDIDVLVAGDMVALTEISEKIQELSGVKAATLEDAEGN